MMRCRSPVLHDRVVEATRVHTFEPEAARSMVCEEMTQRLEHPASRPGVTLRMLRRHVAGFARIPGLTVAPALRLWVNQGPGYSSRDSTCELLDAPWMLFSIRSDGFVLMETFDDRMREKQLRSTQT
jgi:hypothetical protein